MILAHLRGQLEPGYPQGIRSLLRENLILKAIDAELRASALESRLMLDATLTAPALTQSSTAAKTIAEFNHDIRRLLGNRELDPTADAVPVTSQGAQALIDLYETLMDAGILEDTPDELAGFESFDYD